MHKLDEVLTGYVKGDKKAMSILIDTYKDDLYNLCFRLTFNAFDADDLFQQTWVKVAVNAAKFSNNSFKAWLYRICINQYKDNYRMMMRRKMLIMDEFDSNEAKAYVLSVAGSGNSVEEHMEKQQKKAELIAHINQLPEMHKIPIVLYYYQQLRYAEIATVLSIPEGTVKSRINAAKAKLKCVMEDKANV